jgi:hypothetical protein
MMKAELMAEYLCNHQPYPIRNRLLNNKDFISSYNLRPNAILTIGGKVHVNQNDIFLAIKEALKQKGPVSLTDLDGNKHFVKLEQEHIQFESSSKGLKARLDNFFILSPDRDVRMNKLKQLVDNFGPMAPDFSSFITEADKGELSYDQVDQMLNEIHRGVAALQNHTKHAFISQQATLENLVPSSLTYFDYFCGPNPGNLDPEEYLDSVLPIYRKSLIHRNLLCGLDVCLQGALRDDLMPGGWVLSYADDELWDCFEACDPFRDPFALLGALDIALYRQKDERYESFAEKAITTLIKDEFPRNDGIDVYELLPMIARLILNRINVIEGVAIRPPYWKRMCAWMQAGFLIRQTQKLVLNLEGIKKWISSNVTQAGSYACLLDLQHEPMFQATEMSRSSFRNEILGRLCVARDRHKKYQRDIPKSDEIDNAISSLENQGSPLCLALPGPLDGHIRPAEKGINLPEEGIKRLSDDLFSDQAERALSALTYFSQIYDLGDDLLLKVREVIIKSHFDNEFTGFPEILKRIIDTGFIACAHRNIELAQAVVAKIVEASPWANSEFSVGNIIQALLIAGASFQEEDKWAKWLGKQLAEVAYLLPAGEKTKDFLLHIRELKKVLNLKMGILSQAEAIVSAAI